MQSVQTLGWLCALDLSAGITALQSRPCVAPGIGQALPNSHPHPALTATSNKHGLVVRRQDTESQGLERGSESRTGLTLKWSRTL